MQAQTTRTRWETIENAVRAACAQGDFASAETILRYAAREYELSGELDPRLLPKLEQLLQACFKEKLYELAEGIYWLTLDVRKILLGPNHPDVSEHLDN